MTNKDMVPRPGPGPEPRSREAPKGSKKVEPGQDDTARGKVDPLNDPPDSPQLKPSQDRK